MFDSETWWTITPYDGTDDFVFLVGYNSFVDGGTYLTATTNEVRPTLNLNSEVKITGGNGSQSNPYTIE